MHTDLLLAIAMIIGLGMFAQWLAWRIRLPSIVFLLLIGLIAGPISATVLGSPLLDVEAVLGDLLFPVVSVSVALILFEGGLSLRFKQIQGSSGVVRNLVTLGVLLTWLLSAGMSYVLFDLSVGLSLLLGATVVVTGPTVIIPLLRQIRPQGRVGSILRWEGILIDPIGAVLAVLILEELLIHASLPGAVWALTKTILIGGIVGWISAQLMIETYRRFWVPDNLQNPVTVGLVIAVFTLSNILQAESGLVTVTVMGITLANQKRLDIRHIVEFKETLQVLLLSSLFIILSARMQPSDLQQFGWATAGFVAVIIFVERPLAVWLSTLGSDLTWKERVFIAWMAPRGIVAAAVASLFAQELAANGYADADKLVPFTFSVIIGTVTIYSLTAGPLARWLGLSESNPQGLVIIGATRWVRDLANNIQDAGFRVLLTDTNAAHVRRARRDDLEIYQGNVLSEVAEDELDFGGIGRLLAMTPNGEVNALTAEHYQHTFGAEGVYQLERPGQHDDDRSGMARHIGGRVLFPKHTTYDEIDTRYDDGGVIRTVTVQEADAFADAIPECLLPLFTLPDDDTLTVWAQDDPPQIREGLRLIALFNRGQYETLRDKGVIISEQAQPDDDTAPADVATTGD